LFLSTYTFTTVKSLLSGSIQIGTELGESSDFTVLGQEKLQGTDTGHGKTDVNGWSDTLVEELGLQEDLSVSDGNNVGWNVSGDITTLSLNDRQGSQGASSKLVVHLGSTLEKTRVEVENVTGVSLTSWWTTEKERHLTVGNGLLRQIVEDNQGVLAVIAEPFTHRGSCKK